MGIILFGLVTMFSFCDGNYIEYHTHPLVTNADQIHPSMFKARIYKDSQGIALIPNRSQEQKSRQI